MRRGHHTLLCLRNPGRSTQAVSHRPKHLHRVRVEENKCFACCCLKFIGTDGAQWIPSSAAKLNRKHCIFKQFTLNSTSPIRGRGWLLISHVGNQDIVFLKPDRRKSGFQPQGNEMGFFYLWPSKYIQLMISTKPFQFCNRQPCTTYLFTVLRLSLFSAA